MVSESVLTISRFVILRKLKTEKFSIWVIMCQHINDSFEVSVRTYQLLVVKCLTSSRQPPLLLHYFWQWLFIPMSNGELSKKSTKLSATTDSHRLGTASAFHISALSAKRFSAGKTWFHQVRLIGYVHHLAPLTAHAIASTVGVPHATVDEDEYMGYRIPKGAVVLSNIWYRIQAI